MARMRYELSSLSASVDGQTYKADADGYIDVPDQAVATLISHGWVAATAALKQDAPQAQSDPAPQADPAPAADPAAPQAVADPAPQPVPDPAPVPDPVPVKTPEQQVAEMSLEELGAFLGARHIRVRDDALVLDFLHKRMGELALAHFNDPVNDPAVEAKG